MSRFLLVGATLTLFLFSISSHAQLRGDGDAIALAEQIVESIGGREVWSAIRSLHVLENSRSINGSGIRGEFWRDLIEPQERYTLLNQDGMEVEFWWNENGVYQLVNGERQTLPGTLHDEVQDYWHGEIYVMYRRLAVGDADLELAMVSDNSFTARSKSEDRLLGEFWVNQDGELYRWRHADGTEYIYGPMKQFGDIRFPDWGTQVDGSWSFYYEEVVPSSMPPNVSFAAPED